MGNFFFVCYLCFKLVKQTYFMSSSIEQFHLIVFSSFVVSVQILNSRSNNFVFLGTRAKFQNFLLKKYVLAFLLLHSTVKKDSRFINSEQFHLMLLYLFWLEFKLKEHWFHVYRDQWNNSIILANQAFVKKLCFSVFVSNSIEDRDSTSISGQQFHLMVPVSFPFRLQI